MVPLSETETIIAGQVMLVIPAVARLHYQICSIIILPVIVRAPLRLLYYIRGRVDCAAVGLRPLSLCCYHC